MRYPKAWRATNRVIVHSFCRAQGKREYGITMYVNKPGTPHHERRVIAELSLAEILNLKQQIELSIGNEAPDAAR